MSLSLNSTAVTFARRLIQDGKVNNGEGHWGEHNPGAAEENAYLEAQEMGEYGNWHLGMDMSQAEDTKARYHFPYGDFQTVYRAGLVAAKQRAAQQSYSDIEKAADELLHLLEQDASLNEE